MSDLISRSVYKSKLLKALDVLNKEYREAMLNEDDDLILAIKNQQSAYMIALRLLDNEPTAYDIDKVVEKFDKKYNNSLWIKGNDEFSITRNELIEIVKQVGVSDDVCEWKYNDYEYYFESSCEHLHIFMSDGPKENEYRFCPYCGKKIKIVGD